MKILIINSEYPPIGGGAGNASANLAQRFAASGHEVTVLTAHFAESAALEVLDGVAVHRVSALRRRRDRSGPLEQLVFILAAAFYSAKLAPRIKPNIVLAFFGMPSGAVAWLLKRRYQIPFIVSLRGGDVPGFRPYDFRLYHKMIAPALRLIWKEASAIVANSEGLRELARRFDSSVKISVIPNGVEASFFAVSKRSWGPARLLSVGRVVHQKGFDLGLEALAGLKDLNWEWSIAGDGPLTGRLQERARQLGLADRVHFLGWQSRQQLLACYQEANLFLFPSRHEGMPNALLEAMASGLPAVTTRIAGNEELVVDSVTGILVESENTESLRSALRSLLGEEQLRRKMGIAARQKTEQKFSWENSSVMYLKLLEKEGRNGLGLS